MIVIPYARFSPRPNGEKCESAEEQCEAMEAWCEAGGHTIVAGPFVDRMISGAAPIEDRPGLLEALGMIKRGQVLLVRRMDRLARDIFVLLTIERNLARQGCRVVSIEGEGTDSNGPQAVFIRHTLANVHELERAMISLRTKIAMTRHQRNGRRMGHKAPIGTEIANDDEGRPKLLRSCSDEVLAVRRMQELRDVGESYRGIARLLTKEGYTPRGKQWYHTTIRAVLDRMPSERTGVNGD